MLTLRGRVIRDQTSAALPDAALKIIQVDDGAVILRGVTGDGGAFSGDVAEAPRGPLRIDVRHAEGVASAVFVPEPDGEVVVRVTVHGPQLRIAGRLLYDDDDNGAPLSGAKVTLTDTNPDGSRDVIFSAQTDAKGRFAGLSEDWWDLVSQERWNYQDSRLESETVRSDEDELDLTLTIAHNGHTLRRPFPFVGDDVEVIVAVPVELQEHAASPASAPLAAPEPAPAPAPDPDRFRLEVSAQVRHADGVTPVAGAAVTLLQQGPGGSEETILVAETDAEGRFAGRTSPWKESSAELVGMGADGVLFDGDLLTLYLRVEQGARSATVPFYFVLDGVAVEVTVPWTA